MLVQILAELDKDAAEMERNVFEFPPADWPEFKLLLGRWRGLDEARQRITQAIEGDEARERSQ